MQSVEFSTEELEVLRQVLQHFVTEIDVEVFRTDAYEFKEMLKHRRDILERLLEKVSALPQPA